MACNDLGDLFSLLDEGIKHRKIGSHELNKDSSRSHSILTLYIIKEVLTSNGPIRSCGKVSFVDLAGSERLKDSRPYGCLLKETQQINKSLFTLGKVISLLADRKQPYGYIPYRDSKLTMLLMDSLG